MVVSFPGQFKGGGAVVATCDQPPISVQPASRGRLPPAGVQPRLRPLCQMAVEDLGNSHKDLMRLEVAARAAVASIGSADALTTRDGMFAAVFATAQDSSFWRRDRWLHEILQPLKDFASWIRGCDCCEALRLQKKKVECPWQGCRAAVWVSDWGQQWASCACCGQLCGLTPQKPMSC